eukprot:1551053-Rhodomonas_salina.1
MSALVECLSVLTPHPRAGLFTDTCLDRLFTHDCPVRSNEKREEKKERKKEESRQMRLVRAFLLSGASRVVLCTYTLGSSGWDRVTRGDDIPGEWSG